MLKEILHKFLKNTSSQETSSSVQQSHHLWWSTQGSSTELANDWIIGDREIILEKTASFSTVSTFLQKEKAATLQYFCVNSEQGPLHFSPILSDRALLVSLPKPQWLLHEKSISLYILSPIWLRISLAPTSSAQETLCEFSSQSLRWCWSGSNTRTGDLCYRSPVEISMEPLTQWASWQVMTPVVFINQEKTPLLVKEILLPHPFLNLCLKPNGQLYTFSNHYIYQEDTIDLKLNVGGGDPQDQILGARNDSAHDLKMDRLLASMQPL